MANGLEHLLSEGIVSEVVGRLKSGKEADVYAVNFGGKVVAAKVYKDRAHRSFKNNASYQEGRAVRNSRSQRAMDRKTSFGQAAAEAAWKSAEADALYKLYAAEVRVPAPVLFLDGVLLMELVLDEEGEPAPRLIDAPLTVVQANAAYHDMLKQLVRILACDLIHGDLSPYNVLWAAKGATIIDFPQIISASHNSSSEAFFLRDARNILGYFASIDRSLQARSGDAMEIWRTYVRRELTPEFVPVGRTRAPFGRPSGVPHTEARHPSNNRDERTRGWNSEVRRPLPQQTNQGRYPIGVNVGRSERAVGHARPASNGPVGPPQAPGQEQSQRGSRPQVQQRGRPGHPYGPSGQRPNHGGQSAGPGPNEQRATASGERSGSQNHRGNRQGTGRSNAGHNRPAVPEVIVRIARNPRPMPAVASGDEPEGTSAEPPLHDAAQNRVRPRG